MRPIDDYKVDNFCQWLRKGANQTAGLKASKISHTTHYTYMERGEIESKRLENEDTEPLDSEARYLSYFEKVTEAIAYQVLSIEGSFHQGAVKNWRGAQAWLQSSPSSPWNAGLRTLNALTDDALSALGLHKRMTKEQRRQLGKLIKKDEEAAAAALIIFNLAREIIDMDITQIQAVDDQAHAHLTDAELDDMMRERGLLDDDGSDR